MRTDSSDISDIKQKIVERRRERIAREGHELGHNVPQKRSLPLVPFLSDPKLICEVKRRSPSKGNIAITLDPVEQAGKYRSAGVASVSVLTEEDFFSGSLSDLMAIKTAYPDLALLRKDFLVDTHDIDVSFRAGADAVLLIASLLSEEALMDMYRHATSLGMAVLFEIHEPSDIAKARAVGPKILGINCRDLRSFSTDLVYPLKMKALLAQENIAYEELVFESGVSRDEDAAFVLDSGFSAILVGESVVKEPSLVELLLGQFGRSQKLVSGFWRKLYQRAVLKSSTLKNPLNDYGGPLVKICGLTRREDVLLADKLGADILGFIFAESARRCTKDFVISLGQTGALKVAVVVLKDGEENSGYAAARDLLDAGLIDAIQFHGEERPDECFKRGFPYYKALRIAGESDITAMASFRSPRVLVDAFSKEAYGGTGKQIEEGLLDGISQALWLAGGLNPGNIGEVIQRQRPELVDVSSGIELTPGKKDHQKMMAFFDAIRSTIDGIS